MKPKTSNYFMVFVASANRREAIELARLLIDRRVAACVNMLPPMTSVFRWKGKVQSAKETLLIIKTTGSRYRDLEKMISSNHSYEVPEIIAIRIDRGLNQYLGWVNRETSIS